MASTSDERIYFKPLHLGNPKLTRRVERGSFTTFTCADPLGSTVSEIDVPQVSFLVETVSELPAIFFQAIGQKDCFDFRKLIGVNTRRDVSCAWAAFGILVKWLNTGIYQNDEVEATHIDAYLLSETLQSPRFGNAVMQQILDQIPAMKDDGNLADTIRRLCNEAIEDSLLKKLFFDAAIWWFPPSGLLNGTRNPRYFEGAGFLNLNDGYWLNTLEGYKRETCHCSPAKRKKGHVYREGGMYQEEVLGCRTEPWLDVPTRYLRSE